MASPFLILTLSFFTLSYFAISLFALKVHVGADTGLSVAKECSKTCESSFCKLPPLLRYGKYCGILYSGCPGEKPCDELDACCMKHDACISANNRTTRFVVPLKQITARKVSKEVSDPLNESPYFEFLPRVYKVSVKDHDFGLIDMFDEQVDHVIKDQDNYLSEVCNKGLLGCVERFKKSGSKTFKGNTCDVNDVTSTISYVMDAAVLAGRYIHKPSN